MDVQGETSAETEMQEEHKEMRCWGATYSIRQWERRHQPWLESMGNGNKVFGETMGLELGKQAFGISTGIQRRRNLSLWRGRPLQNRKRHGTKSRSR
jgi:hypothetical protein